MTRSLRVIVASLLLCLVASSARAQFTGFSVPQPVSTVPFPAGTACTGAQQVALVPNLGQTEHFLTVITSGVVAFRATAQGSHDGVTFNDITDVATTSGNTVMGQGYYPVVQISVTCATASGTFGVRYSGEATAPAMQIAALQSAQIDKTIAVAVTAGSNFTSQTIRAPFGTSGGGIYFSYTGAGPAGSTINVGCGTLALSTPNFVASFPLATTSALTQFFTVPVLPCDFVTIFYNAGGASASTFTASYVFNSTPITGGDPCQGSTATKKSAAINATATQQLVAGLTSHQIFICGYNFTVTGSTTSTALLEWGTSANCAAGTTSLSGAWAGNAITASSDPVHVLAGGGYAVATVPSGGFLCIVAGGATPSVQGLLTYVQQ